MMPKSYPLDWHVGEHNKTNIYDARGFLVASVTVHVGRIGNQQKAASDCAEQIVRAVNSHDELIAMLARLVRAIDRSKSATSFDGLAEDAKSLISKIEGK